MKLNKTIGIRLTESEFKELHLEAKENGVTTSEYIRQELKQIRSFKKAIISDYAQKIVELRRGIDYQDPTDKWINLGKIVELKRSITSLIDDLDFNNDERVNSAIREWDTFLKAEI